MLRSILSFLAAAVALSAMAFRVDTLAVATPCLPDDEGVTVVVPRQAADTSVPTVYILNGYSGNHLDYISRIKGLGDMADRFGMIFVMPDGRNSWYWDTDSMKMETFIARDLVAEIDSRYPTIANRDNRAIVGLSMGGHGAFRLATLYPHIWGSAGAMSGGMDITKFAGKWGMDKLLGKSFDEDPDLWRSSSVAAMVPKMKDAGVNYTFDCGSSDFFADVNAALHQALLEADVPHDYTSRPGNHSWAYWNNSLPYILHYFDTKFTGK